MVLEAFKFFVFRGFPIPWAPEVLKLPQQVKLRLHARIKAKADLAVNLQHIYRALKAAVKAALSLLGTLHLAAKTMEGRQRKGEQVVRQDWTKVCLDIHSSMCKQDGAFSIAGCDRAGPCWTVLHTGRTAIEIT